MDLNQQLADQFREVYLSGTWVATTNLKKELSDVTWEEATTRVDDLNTLADLAFHLNYYVAGVTRVLEGGPLDIRDKYSFDAPPIRSREDWEERLAELWRNGEQFARLVEAMPEEKLWADFADPKYGNNYRNIQVIVEHSYYHLGQIVLIKKLLRGRA